FIIDSIVKKIIAELLENYCNGREGKEFTMEQTKKGFFQRSLDRVERVGNKLPHPVTLFAILALLVIIVSAITSIFNVTVQHPGDPDEIIEVNNLLSSEGINYIFSEMTNNFIGFAPLGVVLLTMLGIGVAERSGFIGAVLRGFVLSVPQKLVTLGLVFAGVMSSVASDAGYVVLPPLGAVLFAAVGRHPLAGLTAAFSGVSAGFSANLFLSGTDVFLGEMTMDAAKIIDPAYAEQMNVAMNWWFIAASVFLLTLVGAWVTEKIVVPRLGEYTGIYREKLEKLDPIEKKGILWALVAIVVTTILAFLLVLPEGAPMRGDGERPIIESPFMQSLVPIIMIIFLIPGYVYGRVT